ncbi:MAG: hypothetical protein ACLFM4_02580 [Phormidium sp.]
MSKSRSMWLEPIVQIPLIIFGICLIGYALFRFFDFGWATNLKWMLFWMGAAWISLMWALTLPLDRVLFQGVFGMAWNLAGQLAIGHALFWTVAVLGILLKLLRLPIPDIPDVLPEFLEPIFPLLN